MAPPAADVRGDGLACIGCAGDLVTLAADARGDGPAVHSPWTRRGYDDVGRGRAGRWPRCPRTREEIVLCPRTCGKMAPPATDAS